MPRLAIIAHQATATNLSLLDAARAHAGDAVLLSPGVGRRWLRPGDTALARLDVLSTMSGPEPGLDDVHDLERNGVTVRNRAGGLLGVHDKLATAIRLGAHGLPHPRTVHVDGDVDPRLGYPVVVKPRFGSWGRDVHLCTSSGALERCLHALARREWFQRQGALVQELIHPQGRDLRLIVAAGRITGAIERVAAAGEWRTNVSLGGRRRTVDPPAVTRLLALEAANALETDLVGVDLLPDGTGGWTILELNGAVEFNQAYALSGEDVHEEAIRSLLDRRRDERGMPGCLRNERGGMSAGTHLPKVSSGYVIARGASSIR
jgi:RimK family alpha-L-glutamate ligase